MWSEENNMQLHEDKFELICYRTPAAKILAETLPFMADVTKYTTPNGTTIERSPLVRDLGVNMSEELSWTPHINIMVDKARQISSWVLGVFRDRSKPEACKAPTLQIPHQITSGILLPPLESNQDH